MKPQVEKMNGMKKKLVLSSVLVIHSVSRMKRRMIHGNLRDISEKRVHLPERDH